MEENVDFYFNEQGLMVFTTAYHLKRGYCCKNNCLHCPWKKKSKQPSPNEVDKLPPKDED